MVRRARLPSRALPEPTPEEKIHLINDAVQAIKEDDVNKLLSCIPRGVDIRSIYQFYLGDPRRRRKKVEASLLHLAILNSSVECSKFLLHIGAPKEASENTLGDKALHIAVRNRKYSLAEVLLDYGAQPTPLNRRHDTPLHVAARNGDVHIVKLLLKEGADINAKNRYGEKALTVAEISGTAGSRACADVLYTFRTPASLNSYL